MKPRFTLQIQGAGQMLPQILLEKGIGFNQWESGAVPDLSSAPGVTQLHQPQAVESQSLLPLQNPCRDSSAWPEASCNGWAEFPSGIPWGTIRTPGFPPRLHRPEAGVGDCPCWR